MRRASGREVDQDALVEAGRWRETAFPENIAIIDFYSAYLVGQYAGMGRALSLDAIRAALDIARVDREEWPDMTARLLHLHAIYLDQFPEK